MPTEADTLQLIRTKLYRPRVGGDLVPRPRLLARVEERRGRPLALPMTLAVKELVLQADEQNRWVAALISSVGSNEVDDAQGNHGI